METNLLTHNVKRFKVEKPAGYAFVPGQATDVAINKPGLEKELRPFTFTCLPDDNHLEFMIKIYTDHEGVTKKLRDVNAGDELILHEVFGAIEFKGPGLFVAGGAGITPFVAILRHLKVQNQLQGSSLLFANRTEADIILKDELRLLLKENYINVIEAPANGAGKRIDKEMLRQHLQSTSSYCYVCGPDKFTTIMVQNLRDLGVNKSHIIIEQ